MSKNEFYTKLLAKLNKVKGGELPLDHYIAEVMKKIEDNKPEVEFKKVKNKLRVYHFPQVPCKAFEIEVSDEIEAFKTMRILSEQHLFLYWNNFIPDFSNAMGVQMWDEDCDGEGNAGWTDYYNEEEGMDFDELENSYLLDLAPISNYRIHGTKD